MTRTPRSIPAALALISGLFFGSQVTAGPCGYTPQFKGLEALNRKYRARGLVVTGSSANPVFRELARKSSEPSWNFNKYLVSADGKVVQHFDSDVKPDSAQLTQAIEKLLD